MGLKRQKTTQPETTKQSKSAGFMLIEVLIAVVLLAVGLTIILESIMKSIDACRLSREYTKAIFLAKAKMWDLEERFAFRDDFPEGEESGEFEDEGFSEYTWESEVEQVDDELAYFLKVTIKWLHKNSEKQFSVNTLVPMPRRWKEFKE